MGRGASARKLTAKRPAADTGGATAAANLSTRPKSHPKSLPSGPRHSTATWEPIYAGRFPERKKPKPTRVTGKVDVVELADSPCSSVEREKMDKRLQRFGTDSLVQPGLRPPLTSPRRQYQAAPAILGQPLAVMFSHASTRPLRVGLRPPTSLQGGLS